MAEKVCCPRCWSWSELGKSPACRRCGTPLIHGDGRRVDLMPMAPPISPHWAYQTAEQMVSTEPLPPPLFPVGAPPSLAATYRKGIDWVGVARLMTIAYGALTVLAILAFGLLVRQITLPVADPNTGVVAMQTLDFGAAFVFAAVVSAVIFAAFVWLTQFTLARAGFLMLDGLAVLGALTNLADRPASLFALGLGSLILDAVYGYVLVMSLISAPPRPAFA